MNELSAKLLESAWQDLKPKRRTPQGLEVEARTDWIIWRNHQVEEWGVEILPYVQRRPATDYYFDTKLGDACLAWLNAHGFYSWEIPAYDGEDDDFVYHFVAHWLAVMAWLAFEPDGDRREARSGCWDQFDATEDEIEAFFNFKMDYAPRPPQKKEVGAGVQLTMF